MHGICIKVICEDSRIECVSLYAACVKLHVFHLGSHSGLVGTQGLRWVPMRACSCYVARKGDAVTTLNECGSRGQTFYVFSGTAHVPHEFAWGTGARGPWGLPTASTIATEKACGRDVWPGSLRAVPAVRRPVQLEYALHRWCACRGGDDMS